VDDHAPNIELTSVAEAMLDQLSSDERREVLTSVERAALGPDLNKLHAIRQSNGRPPFYVLRVSPKLRVFLSHGDQDHLVVLDVIKRTVAVPASPTETQKAATTTTDTNT